MSGGSAGGALGTFFPHSAETDGVIVRVVTSYLPEQSDPDRGQWTWAYHIRIENHGADEIRLLTRHWTITDARGRRQTVEGDGVVGEQPTISPGQSFDYVSGCALTTARGHMEGRYGMTGADGSARDVAIPRFALAVPALLR